MSKMHEIVKNELKRLTELYKNGNLPDICSRAFIKIGDKPSNKWSFHNRCIMAAHGFSDARGYQQWRQVERFVMKGQHGFYILVPNYITVKTDEIDPETNQPKTKKILNPNYPFLFSKPVFGAEQTDGKPLPEATPKDLPPLTEVAKKLGINVQYQGGMQGLTDCWGFFSPQTNSITLYTHDPQVFYHELMHALQQKLEGKQLDGKNSAEYAYNEVIAELGAATIASAYGFKMNAEGGAYHYVKMYADLVEKEGEESDKVYRAIMKVLSKVEMILNFVFPAEETEKVEISQKVF